MFERWVGPQPIRVGICTAIMAMTGLPSLKTFLGSICPYETRSGREKHVVDVVDENHTHLSANLATSAV